MSLARGAPWREREVVCFAKGAGKEDVARPYFRRAQRDGRTGVVMIGVAQKTRRTRPKDPDLSTANDARSHATIRIRAFGGRDTSRSVIR